MHGRRLLGYEGFTASAAIARITKACADERWLTPERQRVLDEYDQLQSAAHKIVVAGVLEPDVNGSLFSFCSEITNANGKSTLQI